MFAYAHFIPPCTPFCFKATESQVEPQLNSNVDAIKCKKTESKCDCKDVYVLQTSLCQYKTIDYTVEETLNVMWNNPKHLQ